MSCQKTTKVWLHNSLQVSTWIYRSLPMLDIVGVSGDSASRIRSPQNTMVCTKTYINEASKQVSDQVYVASPSVHCHTRWRVGGFCMLWNWYNHWLPYAIPRGCSSAYILLSLYKLSHTCVLRNGTKARRKKLRMDVLYLLKMTTTINGFLEFTYALVSKMCMIEAGLNPAQRWEVR